jgi:multimeric flavodoxin WrbA
MKAIAINGSPRKKWNTATLLENALKGCRASGAEIEMVHLYSHAYQGCTSCLVYTMNVPEEHMPAFHQDASVAASQAIMARIFGDCEVLLCTDTYQFKDYSQ